MEWSGREEESEHARVNEKVVCKFVDEGERNLDSVLDESRCVWCMAEKGLIAYQTCLSSGSVCRLHQTQC